jgi:hypothetical protein
MKIKVTKKAIKNSYNTIIKVSYCSLQNLLNYQEPFAYSTRSEGWSCDYYKIDNNTIISTGYAPIGEIKASYDLTQKYDNKAATIIYSNKDYKETKILLDELLNQFIKEVKTI